MYINLSGLHVLLTGATHSVGRSIATKLGEAGATLALQYNKKSRQAEELVHVLSNNSRSFQADFSKQEHIVGFMDRVCSEFSDLEVVVNNVSQFFPSSLSLSADEWFENWQNSFAVNLSAMAYLSKRAVMHWKKRKSGGRIINISAPLPLISNQGAEIAYATMKAATEAFAHNLSKAVFSDKVKVFTLMLPPLRAEEHLRFTKGERKESQLLLAKPKDVAPVVVFLCSGLADYASGSTIDMSAAQLQALEVHK